MQSVLSPNFIGGQMTKSLINSSENTPFQNVKKQSDSCSIVGRTINQIMDSNSNKKPKFIEKFNTFSEKEKLSVSKLGQSFSPFSQRSQYIQ